MTKTTAKAKVLKVHPSAKSEWSKTLDGYIDITIYPPWGQYELIAIGINRKQAWANAADNLKKGTK